MDTPLDDAVRALADALRAELTSAILPGEPDRLLSIPEAADRLGLGRSALYSELQAGRLRSIKVGRRRLVPSSAIRERIELGVAR